MIQLRKSNERGFADHGWLKSMHTFSFAGYHDERFMGVRSLRVINEDRIRGGTGFGAHGHKDMEIISYVMSGSLKHEDSMGNLAVIRPGEVQRMSAGTGVTHSEFNASGEAEAHFFQIWILPRSRGDQPGYGQKSFAESLAAGDLVLVISGDGRAQSIPINQDVDLHLARPPAGKKIRLAARPGRGHWLQVMRGQLDLNGHSLRAGDAARVEGEGLELAMIEDGEFMLFDLA